MTKMGLSGPFTVENGAANLLPNSFLPFAPDLVWKMWRLFALSLLLCSPPKMR